MLEYKLVRHSFILLFKVRSTWTSEFERRNAIYAIAQKYNARNVRTFGSQLRGEEREDSDVDLLVDFDVQNLLDRIAMKDELEALLGMSVDLLTEESPHPMIRDRVLCYARPL